jgi:hypothetical protein
MSTVQSGSATGKVPLDLSTMHPRGEHQSGIIDHGVGAPEVAR